MTPPLPYTGSPRVDGRMKSILYHKGIHDFAQLNYIHKVLVMAWEGVGPVIFDEIARITKQRTGYEIGEFADDQQMKKINRINMAARAWVKFCKETTAEEMLQMIQDISDGTTCGEMETEGNWFM